MRDQLQIEQLIELCEDHLSTGSRGATGKRQAHYIHALRWVLGEAETCPMEARDPVNFKCQRKGNRQAGKVGKEKGK